jgi:hypothetical protein
MGTGFIAYPGNPPDIGTEISVAIGALRENHGLSGFKSWEENDIAGRFLITPILEQIRATQVLVADVTYLNFNVAFEIGYGVGLARRVVVTRRSDVVGDAALHPPLGIFDTLGYSSYTSGADLAATVARSLSDTAALPLQRRHSSGRPRLFLLEAPQKASYDISLISAIKKSRIGFENYDPIERGRLPAGYAIECVSKEDAFVARFLPKNRQDALIHNIRVAFCAGMAHALGRDYLLLQESEEPVPLDYRDLVRWVPNPNDISQKVGDLVLRLYSALDQDSQATTAVAETLLSKLHLGSSIAENEGRQLSQYYLQTEAFRQAELGEVQAVIGRKGAGKTAFFIELRNSLRRHPQNIVLDLQPEGFRLLKFKERCLSLLTVGSREHLLTALWEYVILLEIAFRILRDDRMSHVHNHLLNKPYYDLDVFLAQQIANTNISDEGDFSERLDRILQHVEQKLASRTDLTPAENALSNPMVTEILYTVDLRQLQTLIGRYVTHKEGLWVLVDNLDKGWPATGVTDDDTRIIRCLQAALFKIEKPFRKGDMQSRGIVFVRSDVYERLIDATPDKGKTRKVSLDFANREILKEILRLRISHAIGKDDIKLDDIWPKIMVSHIGSTAEETCNFIIDRSFMRPRCLLDLIQACRSNAITVGHDKITESDLREGLADYSVELATNIGFEIRDVYHTGPDIVYALIGSERRLSRSQLDHILDEYHVANKTEFVELLLWYGVIGLVSAKGDARYIYDERYEMQKLRAVHRAVPPGGDPVFEINPAFWSALDVDTL